jgi:hypothetical protein
MNKRLQHSPWQGIKACAKLFLVGILTGCLLLLGACSNMGGTREEATNRATVNALLKDEGQAEVKTFEQWIALLQRYKGNVSQYHQEYASDQKALDTANTDIVYQSALQQINQHISSIKILALKSEARNLAQQLKPQVDAWSPHHLFHDAYNGETYQLGYEYGPDGAEGWLDDELSSAQTIADYQQAIEDANGFLTSFRAYQANTLDKTPWNKVHETDLELLNHYSLAQKKAVIVSLSEQALRVYNHGQLIKAVQVTTGRPEKPSLPGDWIVENKASPTVFKSDQPPGSAYWYPDTPINYAMLYHSGGYFIHDSWWRADYGPGTQFPHVDSSGDSFSFDGSHGCVNVSTDEAAWIYNYVDVGTPVLIY